MKELDIFRKLTTLTEGGNVFKDKDKNVLTQRINKEDVDSTLKWLEQIVKVPLVNNKLGTTGKKSTSGDLDIAIDETKITKDEMVNRLKAWCASNNLRPAEYVKKSGISVHFKTAINGDPAQGFVQTDLMFGDPAWMRWSMRGENDEHTEFKGRHRHILMASIASAQGMKWSFKDGLIDRATNEVITKDPDEIAMRLLGNTANAKDLNNVQSIIHKIQGRQDYEKLVTDAAKTFAYDDLKLPMRENVGYDIDLSDQYFLARLRDKIISTDSGVLNETKHIINEGARIEHLEDLVFSEGSKGVEKAGRVLANMSKGEGNISLKWDGSPALASGRDTDGQYVLTDKAGLKAKGYNGLAKSPQDIVNIMSARKGDRTELNAMYARIWSDMEATIPKDFRGYIFGDLLYSNTPPLIDGQYVFTPNTVTYYVDANSAIGKQVSKSNVGFAIHGYFKDAQSDPIPVENVQKQLINTAEVLMFGTKFEEKPKVTVNSNVLDGIRTILQHQGDDIDNFFNPEDLRSLKISSLPGLMKQFINSRVRSNDFNNLAQGFLEWLPSSRASAPMQARMVDYIKTNSSGYKAVFESFIAVMNAKNNVIDQLDKQSGSITASVNTGDGQESGHEGYVANAKNGDMLKLVNRGRFSRANFAANANR